MISFLEIIIYSLFILSVNSLSEPKKAYRGNLMAIAAMAAAVTIGLWGLETKYLILAFSALGLGAITGIIAARKINMPDLPQMVALLNGFGGMASGLIGIAETTSTTHPPLLLICIIGIGFMTFSGSCAAFLKLAGSRLFSDRETIRAVSLIIFITAIISGFYAYSGGFEYV